MPTSFIKTKLLNKKALIVASSICFTIFLFFMFKADSHVVDEALHPTKQYSSWAFYLGALSAISLFFGAIAGIFYTPKPSVIAAMTAFGAGALLAALSIELIAPTVLDIVHHKHDVDPEAKSHAIYTMGSLIFGCITGGLTFFLFDEMLNNKGAFKRKISTIITHMNIAALRKSEVDIDKDIHILDNKELHDELEKEDGAPMSIWLGLLVDGIPESFVIGAGFLTVLSMKISTGVEPVFLEIVPFTLIGGLFLANFPEAMSSAIGMKKQGFSTTKVLVLWGSMVLIVAIGSTIGYWIGAEVPHEIEVGIEGIAAGAMLTMIAQTMIPEAVHIGGPKVVGLSTLIGYLSAISFSLFE